VNIPVYGICPAIGWRRPIACLIFIVHFLRKNPIIVIIGSFVEQDLQLEVSHGFCRPVTDHRHAWSLCTESLRALQCGAVCFCVWQCVAVCCSVVTESLRTQLCVSVAAAINVAVSVSIGVAIAISVSVFIPLCLCLHLCLCTLDVYIFVFCISSAGDTLSANRSILYVRVCVCV